MPPLTSSTSKPTRLSRRAASGLRCLDAQHLSPTGHLVQPFPELGQGNPERAGRDAAAVLDRLAHIEQHGVVAAG
jgi:hypothetical protein